MKIHTLHLIPLLLLLCAALSGCGQRLQAALSLEDVPPFSGEPYVVLGQPARLFPGGLHHRLFRDLQPWICLAGAAPPYANIGLDLMPTEGGTASAKSSPAAGTR